MYLAGFVFMINLLRFLNDLQGLIISYPTSSYLSSFIGIYFIKISISFAFFSLSFALAAFAGESLHSEVFRLNQRTSFLHYIKSTLFSRGVTKSVAFGYLVFFIMLGLQALIFYSGHRYLGVWREWVKLTQLSSSYVPFLSAFIIGASASLSEEVVYRLFGISWAKKYFKNIILAVLIPALIWGFGHTSYAIFPVWFRGIEVSMLGMLLGFIFIKYGLIPLLVAHYLFDVFWGVAAYILGRSSTYLFASSLAILAIPLGFAIIAYYTNRDEKEREIKIMLNAAEEYNLNILINFISQKKSQGITAKTIKEELVSHNWDVTLVDLAISEVFKG
jgi:membrane protease YdiL (CAAX protease family)